MGFCHLKETVCLQGKERHVNESALEQMKGELIDEEVAVSSEVSEITEEWEEFQHQLKRKSRYPKTETENIA